MQDEFGFVPDTQASSAPDEFGFVPDDSGFVADAASGEEEPSGSRFSSLFSNTGPTFKASEGGSAVGDATKNIAKTFANIPSSARGIVRGAIAPVNPFDRGSSMNIGENIVQGVKDVASVYKTAGAVDGTKSIIGGILDTAKKAFKVPGEAYLSYLKKTGYMDDPSIKKLNTTLLTEPAAAISRTAIEDPLLIPSIMYAGPKALEGGGTTDAISEFASATKRGVNKVVTPVKAVVSKAAAPLIDSAVAKQIDSLEAKYYELESTTGKTRKVAQKAEARTAALDKAGTTGQAPQRMLAEDGIIPKQEGTKLTTRDQAQKFRDDTLQYREANRKGLQEVEYAVPQTNIDELEQRAISEARSQKNIDNGDAPNLVKKIREEFANYREAYPTGKVPLTKLDDIKTARWGKVKNFSDPLGGEVDYLIGKSAQKTIEETTAAAGFEEVAQMNRHIGDRMEAARYLESLDGKVVKGGNLTKLVYQAIGSTAGKTLPTKIIGALGGEAVANALISNSVATPVKRMLLRNVAAKDPEAYARTLQWLEEQGVARDLRLGLPEPSPLGSAKNPIVTPAPTTYERPALKSFNQSFFNEPRNKLLPDRAPIQLPGSTVPFKK